MSQWKNLTQNPLAWGVLIAGLTYGYYYYQRNQLIEENARLGKKINVEEISWYKPVIGGVLGFLISQYYINGRS